MKPLFFSILSINDRALDNIFDIQRKMSPAKKFNFTCINVYKEDISFKLKELDVFIDKSFPSKLKGDIGVWMSNIKLAKEIVEKNIEECIVFEDDAILADNFYEKFIDIKQELPDDYDFLTLSYPKSSLYLFKEDAEVNSNKIALAKYNHWGTQVLLWSKKGAKKFLKLVEQTGITYQFDIYLYNFASKNNLLNAYTIHPKHQQLVFHDIKKYGSTIDLNGTRGTLDV